MQITLDYDDFSPLNHRFDILYKLLQRYPKIKITMFTVPWEIRFNPNGKGAPITNKEYKPWVKTVKKLTYKANLELAIHGFTHGPREFENLTYTEAKNRVIVAQKMFTNVGLPYVKLFKAPQWLLSEGGEKAISDLGFKVVKDGYYNWNLKEDKPKRKRKLIAHGHIQDEPFTQNGMEESYFRLISVPLDAKWKFLSEVL